MNIKSALPATLLSVTFFSLAFAADSQEPEEAHPSKSSSEYLASSDGDLEKLMAAGFQNSLQSSALGSSSADLLSQNTNKIKSTWESLNTELGATDVTYDIILQAGHYNRKTGKTGTTGALVAEKWVTAYLVKNISDHLLSEGKYTVLAISADDYSPHLNAKIFLAIHADGSVKQCTTGPSLSYQDNGSTLAMHAIGWGLSQALGYKYSEFRQDGFTVDAAKYYMYKKLNAPIMKGLLEVGELTCPKREEQLIVGIDAVANNVARALSFVLASTTP
ncbi:N-acetylmuramoyl-L-alanine amidase [Pseudomonas sp. NFR16]|uniref:N-acetylmuramoyl-L-alanine amidase n=1 Tax=Pseudomonas sp. NFR16 TaxID=1566248 RepID=UPI0008CCAC9F|nr:N-acetylmuramoyl-L-alanine amidase [Pseudomonas sp. NFR16]SEJ77722.1 N-acetylmuramoyl-L-alanine amidase [Pseudomonas sp. NFR16]